jgi:hypothetical protein
LIFLLNLGKNKKHPKLSRRLLNGTKIHQWTVSLLFPPLGGRGANTLTGEHSKTFAYFNRRLERPAASSLSSRRFLPRRRRHGGSSCFRAANCSNSRALENHFGCGRHGASAAFAAAAAAAHFVAYRSVMFAIVFFSSFLLLFATGKVRKPRCIVKLRRGKRMCLLFRNALGILVKYPGF